MLDTQQSEIQMSLLKGRSYLRQIIDITRGFQLQGGSSPVQVTQGFERLGNTSQTIKNLLEVLESFLDDTQTDATTIVNIIEGALNSVITANTDFNQTLNDLSSIPLLHLNDTLQATFQNVSASLKSVILHVLKVCVSKDTNPNTLIPIVHEYTNALQNLANNVKEILSDLHPIKIFNDCMNDFIKDIGHACDHMNDQVNNLVANASQSFHDWDKDYIFQESQNTCNVEELYTQVWNFTCGLIGCTNSSSQVVLLFESNLQDYTNGTLNIIKNVSLEIRQLLADTENMLSQNIPAYLDFLKSGVYLNDTIYSILNSTDYRTAEICMSDKMPTLIRGEIQKLIPFFNEINSTNVPNFLGNISAEYISNVNHLVTDLAQMSNNATMLARLNTVSLFPVS